MENCFIKKYKGEIANNNNLPLFGMLKITIHHQDNVDKQRIYGSFVNNHSTYKIVGDGHLYNGNGNQLDDQNQEYTRNDTNPLYITNPSSGNTLDLYISKFDLLTYNDANQPWYINLSQFDSLSQLEQLVQKYEKGGMKVAKLDSDCAPLQINCQTIGAYIDLENADLSNLTKLNGCWKVTASKLYSIAQNLVEFSIKKPQSYIIDISRFGGNITNGIYDYTEQIQKFSWVGTKTGKVVKLVNMDFGNYVDAMLINQANLEAEGTIIAVFGTSSYQTDTTIQNALTTLRSKGCTVRLNGTQIN